MTKTKKSAGKIPTFVACETADGAQWTEVLLSHSPVSLSRAVRFFERVRYFDWEEDSISLTQQLDLPETDLDAWEASQRKASQRKGSQRKVSQRKVSQRKVRSKHA